MNSITIEENRGKAVFRPCPRPTPAIPFGTRSVGSYLAGRNWKDNEGVKHFLQLFWGIAKCGLYKTEGEKCILLPQHVFVYFPGDKHSVRTHRGVWNCRWLTIDGFAATEIVRQFGFSRQPRYAGKCPEDLFVQLEHEIKDITLNGQRAAAATAFRIFALAAGDYPRVSANQRSETLAKKAVVMIEENCYDPALNVNSLGDRLGVHRSTLSKIFKKQKNISCIDYLIAVRTQRALSLIKETDIPISRVAEMTGFSSASYFIRTVKKAIGLSPKQFRKQ